MQENSELYKRIVALPHIAARTCPPRSAWAIYLQTGECDLVSQIVPLVEIEPLLNIGYVFDSVYVLARSVPELKESFQRIANVMFKRHKCLLGLKSGDGSLIDNFDHRASPADAGRDLPAAGVKRPREPADEVPEQRSVRFSIRANTSSPIAPDVYMRHATPSGGGPTQHAVIELSDDDAPRTVAPLPSESGDTFQIPDVVRDVLMAMHSAGFNCIPWTCLALFPISEIVSVFNEFCGRAGPHTYSDVAERVKRVVAIVPIAKFPEQLLEDVCYLKHEDAASPRGLGHCTGVKVSAGIAWEVYPSKRGLPLVRPFILDGARGCPLFSLTHASAAAPSGERNSSMLLLAGVKSPRTSPIPGMCAPSSYGHRAVCYGLRHMPDGMKDNCFTSPETFAMHFTCNMWDSQSPVNAALINAALIFEAYSVTIPPAECRVCSAPVVIVPGNEKNGAAWICSLNSSKSQGHTRLPVRMKGAMQPIFASRWLQYLHFVVYMKCDTRWNRITAGMHATYGTSHGALQSWMGIYSEILKRYLVEVVGLELGEDGCPMVVSLDETAVGKDFSMLRQKPAGAVVADGGERRQSGKADHIEKVLPGMTVWKQEAAGGPRGRGSPRNMGPLRRLNKKTPCGKCMPADAVAKRPAAPVGGRVSMKKPGKRGGGKYTSPKWMWGAVECGAPGGVKKSHLKGDKKVFLSLLPDARDAPYGKPRGKVSLSNAMAECLGPHTPFVSDEWSATGPAAIMANVPEYGRCNHSKSYRNPRTGVHSNDIESEWSRFKRWYQDKFKYVRCSTRSTSRDGSDRYRAMQMHMWEYMFYTNCGRDMSIVMKAHAYSERMCDQLV